MDKIRVFDRTQKGLQPAESLTAIYRSKIDRYTERMTKIQSGWHRGERQSDSRHTDDMQKNCTDRIRQTAVAEKAPSTRETERKKFRNSRQLKGLAVRIYGHMAYNTASELYYTKYFWKFKICANIKLCRKFFPFSFCFDLSNRTEH